MRLFLILLLFCQERINWYPTWEAGLQQARLTKKPILLVAGAPQCHLVPGVW